MFMVYCLYDKPALITHKGSSINGCGRQYEHMLRRSQHYRIDNVSKTLFHR